MIQYYMYFYFLYEQFWNRMFKTKENWESYFMGKFQYILTVCKDLESSEKTHIVAPK